MTGIFIANLKSAGEQDAFERSATQPVARERVLSHFAPVAHRELEAIERHARGFYVWNAGAAASATDSWTRLRRDDMVLVNYGGVYRHFARVLGRYRNRAAARAIWGNDSEDLEYLYFISQPVPIELPAYALDDYMLEPGEGLSAVGAPICDRIETDFGNLERFARLRLLGAAQPIAGYDFAATSLSGEQAEAHARQLADIDARRGDAELREVLLRAYAHRCAITANSAAATLEVAYLIPARGPETQSPANALLLRADLHTLFDLGKIAIDTATMTVLVSPELFGSSYRILQGRPLRLPDNPDLRPDAFALDLHRRICTF
jgi:hypothetical protein